MSANVLYLPPDGPSLSDGASAVDVIGEAWAAEAAVVAVPVGRLDPGSFRLGTGVAGELVGKFANYRMHLVVVGDPETHGPTSGPVADWIREANRGGQLWFVADDTELRNRLDAAQT